MAIANDGYHLAQVNIARLLAPLDDPRLEEFVRRLPEINALAEQSPGFVWRLQTEYGDATAINAFNDPQLIVNMSVWESIEDLRAFVFSSEHLPVMKKRGQWFEKHQAIYFAMWWIAAGELPTIEQAQKRLAFLQAHGDSPYAFTWRKSFSPGVSHAMLPSGESA